MDEVRKARHRRLPPTARGRVETASGYLVEQVMPQLRMAGEKLLVQPAEAAVELLRAQQGVYLAIGELRDACVGQAGAEEMAMAGAGNADHGFRSRQ